MKWQLFLLALATVMGSAMMEDSISPKRSTNSGEKNVLEPVLQMAVNTSKQLVHWLEGVAKGDDHATGPVWGDILKLPLFRQRISLRNLTEFGLQNVAEQGEHVLNIIDHNLDSTEHVLGIGSGDNAGHGHNSHCHGKKQATATPPADAFGGVAGFWKAANSITNAKLATEIEENPQ